TGRCAWLARSTRLLPPPDGRAGRVRRRFSVAESESCLRSADRLQFSERTAETRSLLPKTPTEIEATTMRRNSELLLRYDNRHADLLYEVVRRRYDKGGSIVVTTNKAFSEWNQVFESAACLVTLIDRLCHRAEIVEIRGESYRVKESKARSKQRRERRRG